MLRKCHWLPIALFLLTPAAGLARQGEPHSEPAKLDQHSPAPTESRPAVRSDKWWKDYNGPRMGLNAVDLGFSAAMGKRDFNGRDRRTASLYTFNPGVHLSLVEMTLGAWGKVNRDRRLRIGDYWRFEPILGWIMEKQQDVVAGGDVDLAGGDALVAGVLAAGLQASYLVTEMLEFGGAVSKSTWNTTMGFENKSHSALKPTDEPYPLLWVGRARYGSLLGEFHTAATGKYEGDDYAGYADVRLYQHRYSSLRLRYFRSAGNSTLGIDVDRYHYGVERGRSPTTSMYDTNRGVTSVRLSFGYAL